MIVEGPTNDGPSEGRKPLAYDDNIAAMAGRQARTRRLTSVSMNQSYRGGVFLRWLQLYSTLVASTQTGSCVLCQPVCVSQLRRVWRGFLSFPLSRAAT